jgi:N-acetyl-anhydromuramyl-L-alanine amidase AmpD
MQKSDIKYIVVHASDWPENWWWPEDSYGDHMKAHLDKNVTAAVIHWYHKEILGWHGIGYHWCIERDGNIENGRPWYWKGAHVRAYNHEALGIALVGLAPYTDEQMTQLDDVIWSLKCEDSFPNAQVVGHSDLDPSKPNCPGFPVKEWWQGVK